MDIRGAVDAAVPTNIIAAKAAEVRANKVNWQSYLQGQMISAEDCEFIKRFEMARSEEKQAILTNEGHQCAKTFLNLMAHISKEQTVQYILTLIDDTLQENHQRVNIFFDYAKKTKNTAWSYFLSMLNRQDQFTVHMAARIIAKLAAWGRELMEGSDLNYYFNWIKTQLSSQKLRTSGSETGSVSLAESSQYVQCVAGCLQLMLRINEYRFAWVEADGVNCITSVLSNSGFQLQYQMIFCVWLLAFNPQMCENLRRYNVVPVLSDILQESVKEKVTRIILAAFRNLLEKSAERETRQEYALAMIQCKVLKQLENLEQQKYEDEDISDDIAFLLERLGESVQDLSSFDEYSSELKSGRLEWSPVHKSEKFWRENAVRLNEKNYELLKILTRLLEVSDDPQVIAVAAHDVGEYVRHYPRGKRVIEQLGGKQLVMNHMHHEDQQVRYNALLAVQKLMVHNWEYLGKQLQSTEQPAAVTARS
ncbi:V-type proton ATPase subunit H isoform X1 [Megalops cyprinoides]|uniref:V-type proton ATPase subunit H isoform X1 n=1 Tax=Megalops cyprinoides TaxID=118141 RepID=UPI0018645BF4|nr:V-type proton ATPase subunit H isoform X1 [Megalops cyprinoides]XP_036374990.1 V-type proton ATPase subunit H isoform X1 [Megalops cyprinoides]XP_036374991.1 V-type proton ATPase subunit H isoform X1 [Megalops cyprinoides]XP_036374992.1 V-type proton ATPase subunit H isoform X1 [Megalops cyprinoides]